MPLLATWSMAKALAPAPRSAARMRAFLLPLALLLPLTATADAVDGYAVCAPGLLLWTSPEPLERLLWPVADDAPDTAFVGLVVDTDAPKVGVYTTYDAWASACCRAYGWPPAKACLTPEAAWFGLLV